MKRIIKLNDEYVLRRDCLKQQQNCRACKSITNFLSTAQSWELTTTHNTIKYVVNNPGLDAAAFRAQFKRMCDACMFTTTARRLARNNKRHPTVQTVCAMAELTKQH